ncbi:putative gustatory receptor 59d [Drosophila serrata]|uniref:putative gustatory receptor 59d n=1 Tax=Drosophila serrata TaxID=7274 RepID=UPI000A1D2ABE|nr:putative gustatory receptor 59d [Drosophila serrata]
MVDLVKWCLYISYFYGRFSGILNFEIDLKTGRTRVTKRATIYAAGAQVFMFTLLVFHLLKMRWMSKVWTKANSLHEYVFMIMSVFRIVCVLLALVSRWLGRRHFVRLFNSFRRLFLSNPEAIQCCRRGIIFKCFCATVTEMVQLIMALIMMRRQLTFIVALGIWALVTLTAIINIIITQFYIALANIRGSYILLNRKLYDIMVEVQALVPRRRGVFVTKCCSLADRLDEIAMAQSELQDLSDRLSKTFEMQALCMVLSFYMSSVGTFYMMFSAAKYTKYMEEWPDIVLFLGTTYFVFYYMDNWISTYNTFHLLDAHEEMVKILDQRTLFPPGLDNRLEATVSNLTLEFILPIICIMFL